MKSEGLLLTHLFALGLLLVTASALFNKRDEVVGGPGLLFDPPAYRNGKPSDRGFYLLDEKTEDQLTKSLRDGTVKLPFKLPVDLDVPQKNKGNQQNSGSNGSNRKRSVRATGVYHGKTLDFYETQFGGSLESWIWNQNDPKKILLSASYIPYLSVDSGKTFADISSRLDQFDTSYPDEYGQGSGGKGVRVMLVSPADPNYVMILGKGANIWYSKDGGSTFSRVEATYQNQPLFLRYVSMHPSQKNYLFGTHIDSHCLDGSIADTDPTCSNEVYVSTNYGQAWTLADTHAWVVYWGDFSTTTSSTTSVFMLVSSDTSSHQFTTNNGNTYANAVPMTLNEVMVPSYKVALSQSNVMQMLVYQSYIYILAPSTEAPNLFSLWVFAGTAFKQCSFYDNNLRAFTFMDATEKSVFIIDTPTLASSTYNDYRGDLWISESTGTYFVRSLKRVILQASSYYMQFDFHKIESLEGTFIATVADTQGNLRTKITWNKGGEWQDIQSQAAIDGLVDENRTPFVLYGDFHSASSGMHGGFYSEQSAPGAILAVGGYGTNMVDYITDAVTDGDVYYSRNGGKIFNKILSHSHYCRLLDEGSIIICAPGYNATTTFLYSLDQGETWVTETFIDRPVNVVYIVSDPNSFELVAVLIVTDGVSVVMVQVDMTQLNLPNCVDSQYELWTPSDSQDERHCVMGHHTTFKRPAPASYCVSTLNQFVVTQGNCPCGEDDFECTVGYFYNTTRSFCSPEAGIAPDVINCVNGVYQQNLHYQLIPGDTCDNKMPGSVDLTQSVPTECPITDILAENEAKKRLALGLGIGLTSLAIVVTLAIGFIYWSMKKGHLRYRRIQLDDNPINDVELPDHDDHEDHEDNHENNQDQDNN